MHISFSPIKFRKVKNNMDIFLTFSRKEFVESMRTKRILVLGCIFLLFAITGALLGRYMGEFFALIIPGDDAMGQALLEAAINPTWHDSFIQYYSNVSQIGVFAVLLMYMGTVQREVRSGTANLMFTKGLGHGTFIITKFTMGLIITSLISVIAAFVTHIYTVMLFDGAGSVGDLLAGAAIFSIAIAMILSITILGSAFAKSSAGAGGIGFGIYFLLLVASAIPRVGRFVPFALFNHSLSVTIGYTPDTLLINIALAVVVIIGCLYLAVVRLKRIES